MAIKTTILILLLFYGCKNYQDPNDTESAQTEEVVLSNIQYTATLASTDPNVTTMSGTANVDEQGTFVTVSVTLTGIPQNITRLHYAYVLADCSSLAATLPNDTTGTRNFTLNETISVTALQNDLASSGAATTSGDTDLSNKSFIVKAFATDLDQFNNGGSAALTIACGPLNVTGEVSLQ